MSRQYFFYNDCTGCLRRIRSCKQPLKALVKFSVTDDANARIFCFCIDVTKSSKHLVACLEATGLLRQFARSCALDVIHLWKPPAVVKEYLKTGNEALRDAARDAADAASNTASAAANAAWAAANAANAASNAAWAAANAARAAAWAAAGAAARDAAWTTQNQRLEKMILGRIQLLEEKAV